MIEDGNICYAPMFHQNQLPPRLTWRGRQLDQELSKKANELASHINVVIKEQIE